MTFRHLVFALFIFLANTLTAQDKKLRRAPDARTQHHLIGYWTGGYLTHNALQRLEADFFRDETDSLRVKLRMPEWIYYDWSSALSVTQDANGKLHFRTYLGDASMRLDTTYDQMIGKVEGELDFNMRLHLKKAVRPFEPSITLDSLQLDLPDGEALGVSIYRPANKTAVPAIVYIPGRGAKQRSYNTRNLAKWYARNGYACAIFDERGTGTSTGDYLELTMSKRAQEAASVLDYLRRRDDIRADAAGYYGTSTGGWIAQKASQMSQNEPSFVVTWVGPATSVEKQQRDCGVYMARTEGLNDTLVAEVQRYITLTFRDPSGDKQQTFDEMEQLLASGRENNWTFILAETDSVSSAKGMDSLWCRRFAYDNAADLRKMDMPYLALFGENDDIVPVETNVPALQAAMEAADNSDYEIVVIPGQNHVDQYGTRWTTLGSEKPWRWRKRQSYLLFNVVDARIYNKIIAFLDERFR